MMKKGGMPRALAIFLTCVLATVCYEPRHAP